jgi:hypothetical protein
MSLLIGGKMKRKIKGNEEQIGKASV